MTKVTSRQRKNKSSAKQKKLCWNSRGKVDSHENKTKQKSIRLNSISKKRDV